MESRPATSEDAAAVTEIVAAMETLLYGGSTFSQADLEGEWAEIEVERDARVVVDGGRIAGYGVVRERNPEAWEVEGYVHPDAHGRGIGTLIARELEAAATVPRLHHNVLERDDAARALLEALGYERVRLFREMRIELAARPPAPKWPDGLRATPFDQQRDARAFHAAVQEAFADHWEFTPRSFESWSRVHFGGERYDPALWGVVRDGDEIAAGTVSTAGTYGGGFVHTVFTGRPWRRRGVGAALLADAFRRLYDAGERSVGLGVDAASDTGAFRLYERAGMTPTLGWAVYEKRLSV